MDLSKIGYSTDKLNILNPETNQPIGLSVELVHVDDPSLRSVRRAIEDKLRKLSVKGKTPTGEQIEANRFQLLTGMLKGWTWEEGVNWQGEQLEFTPSNVKMLLKELPTFADQIDAHGGDLENFIKS